MRILLDESVPRDLAADFAAHDVSTVRKERWIGLRNGVLLRAAAAAGFDVLITMDRSLPYQQNLRAIGIAVVVITRVRNHMRELRPLIPQIENALVLIRPGDVFEVSPPGRDVVREYLAPRA
ncbi:MAG TPA: hypothetical protein VGS96_21465 [Thermoanaerobaculia bacterium]|nr:hypothetical protein [Thermoanaerobaculia bacterium]